MNIINKLIELLDDKHEDNNGEYCKWCESDSYPVNKDGERISSTEDADHYRFNCEVDCLERLIPAALEILRQAVKHPANEPPDTDREVLVQTGYPFDGAKKSWHTDRYINGRWQIYGKKWVRAWRELLLVSRGTK